MRDGVRDRLMPPKYLLEKVSSQAQGIADDSPDDSLEKSPFTEPLRKISRFDSGGGPEAAARGDRRRGEERSRAGVREVREVCARGLRAARAGGSRRVGNAGWRRALPIRGAPSDDDRSYRPNRFTNSA